MIRGDPLIIDGKIYSADNDYVTILELAKERRVIVSHEVNQIIESSPVFANGSLYILTDGHLFAIGTKR